MISRETAYAVALCYDEITKADKLVENLEAQVREYKIPELRDGFGRQRCLQLGVPSGESSHRLYDVQPNLAIAVVKAHAATKRSELILLNETAKTEVNTP